MPEISEPNSPTLLGPSNQKSKLTSGGRSAVQPPCPATPTQPRYGHRAASRQNARHFDVTVWREICRSGPENLPSPRANTPLVCPREGLVEQQSLKEEIRFPKKRPYGLFQPRTQHGKRPSGSKNEKIDTGALPTLFFGPNPRPMGVLAAMPGTRLGKIDMAILRAEVRGLRSS